MEPEIVERQKRSNYFNCGFSSSNKLVQNRIETGFKGKLVPNRLQSVLPASSNLVVHDGRRENHRPWYPSISLRLRSRYKHFPPRSPDDDLRSALNSIRILQSQPGHVKHKTKTRFESRNLVRLISSCWAYSQPFSCSGADSQDI